MFHCLEEMSIQRRFSRSKSMMYKNSLVFFNINAIHIKKHQMIYCSQRWSYLHLYLPDRQEYKLLSTCYPITRIVQLLYQVTRQFACHPWEIEFEIKVLLIAYYNWLINILIILTLHRTSAYVAIMLPNRIPYRTFLANNLQQRWTRGALKKCLWNCFLFTQAVFLEK